RPRRRGKLCAASARRKTFSRSQDGYDAASSCGQVNACPCQLPLRANREIESDSMLKPAKHSAAEGHERSALIAGIAAFATWGLIPGYWKLLKAISPPEILAHRFVWTSLFLV